MMGSLTQPKAKTANADENSPQSLSEQDYYGLTTAKNYAPQPDNDVKDLTKKLDDYGDPEADTSIMEHFETSRKLSISQKLFKLRNLCKCHL